MVLAKVWYVGEVCEEFVDSSKTVLLALPHQWPPAAADLQLTAVAIKIYYNNSSSVCLVRER